MVLNVKRAVVPSVYEQWLRMYTCVRTGLVTVQTGVTNFLGSKFTCYIRVRGAQIEIGFALGSVAVPERLWDSVS
jgi:hypothetical protein